MKRKTATITAVSRYLNILSIDKVVHMPFDLLVDMLKTPETIQIARECIEELIGICNVRIFIAAYMIAYKTSSVIEEMDALSTPMVKSATTMLVNWEAIMNKKMRCDSSFHAIVQEYFDCFKAWKIPDTLKLVTRIGHALGALYTAQDYLPVDEPADSALKVEFCTQIDRLRAKLVQIGGPESLVKFDESNVRVAGERPANGSGVYIPGRITNEQLAHELLFDGTFQLDDERNISNPIVDKIRDAFQQSYWNSLTDDLRTTVPCYKRVLRVLVEVRDGIKELASSTIDVSAVIDVDMLKAQTLGFTLQQKWANCQSFVDGVCKLITRVQAPKRDAQTAKGHSVIKELMSAPDVDHPRAFAKALEFLLNSMNLMRIDAANARLRLIAPVIRDHGIDYERGKFQDKLTAGTLTTARTEAWLAASGIPNDGTHATLVKIHSSAMLSLVTCNTCVRAETVPETMLFDLERIAELYSRFHRVVDGCTILVTVLHSFGADAKSHTDAFQLFSKRMVDMPVINMDNGIAALESTGLLNDITRSAFTECLLVTHPVRMLIASRVRNIYAANLGLQDHASFPAAAPFVPSIDTQTTTLANLATFNCAIHLPTYTRLLHV